MGDQVRVVFRDRQEAVDAYRSGLRHGLLTAQIDPPPPPDEPCRIDLELAFARLHFPLRGTVVHSGAVATVVRVEALPDKVHRMLGGNTPPPPPASVHTTMSRDVRDLGSGHHGSSGSLPASDEPESSSFAMPPVPSNEPPPSLHSSSAGSHGSAAHEDEPSVGLVMPEPGESWDQPGPHTVTRDGSVDDEELSLPQVGERYADPERRETPPERTPDRRPPDLSSSPSFRMGRPKRSRNYLAEALRRSSQDRRSAEPQPAAAPRSRPSRSTPEPAPRRVHGLPADATPVPTQGVAGPGIPVPYQPNRYLPAVAKFEGTLGKTSAYEMLLRAYDAQLTGVGVLDLPHERYWLYMLNGKPVHYLREPELQSESTEALLIRKKLLNQSVLDWARWLSEVTAQPLVSVVMRLKLITEGQLHSLRTTQVKMITRRVLDQRQGSFRFYEAPDVRRVFRNPAVTVTEMLWKRASFSYANLNEAQIESQLEKMSKRDVGVTALGNTVLPEVPLSPEQRAMVDRHIVPGHPVPALFADTSLKRREVVELLLCLRLMGLVHFSRRQRGADPEASRLGRELREQYKRTDRDYFGFLELHWAALPAEMGEACDRIDEQLAEAAGSAAFIPNFDRMVDRVQARLGQVRELIENPRKRRDYRARQVGEAERTMAAEMYLKQAEMAVFRENADEARDCFERMLEIDPGGAGSRERRDRARLALEALRQGKLPTRS